MVAVLILDEKNDSFYPILNDKSLSFLPIGVNSNLLGFFYSRINSYFSKDKIYVVCEKGEEELVAESCSSINEENIIIEPLRIDYHISVFFASLVIGKILPDSRLFFFPVNFLFSDNFKMGSFIFASSEMVLKDWLIIPSIAMGKNDIVNENIVEGGKPLCNTKGVDFFEIENFIKIGENSKKRKIFGKQGKNIGALFGKQKVLVEYFLKYSKEILIKNLYNCFKYDSIVWDNIVSEYNSVPPKNVVCNYFTEVKGILTIFIDTKVYDMNSWRNYLGRFADVDSNLISGEITHNDCKGVVCLNYDNGNITIDSLRNTVIFKKNGHVAIKSINQL